MRTYVRVGLLLTTVLALALLAGGETPAYAWTAPAALNTNAATDSGTDWWPQITTDGAGHWVAVWWSDDTLGNTIGTDFDILVSRSTDDGVTWTDPVALNSNADSDSGDDEHPRVITDTTGNWLAVWESNDTLGGTIGTDSDILASRSTNNGVSWTTPQPLNSNASTDEEGDEIGILPDDDQRPYVATDGGGKWVAVWHSMLAQFGTDADILVSRSTDNGETWTAVAPLYDSACYCADADPVVATDGAGHWVAAWRSNDPLGDTIEIDFDILVSRSTDDGATWTDPAPLNSNAYTPVAYPNGQDAAPQITTDGAGNWVAVWYSGEDVDGTIGTDNDILVALSTDNGTAWTPATPLPNASTDSGDNSTATDLSPQIITDRAGSWVVVWGSRDIMGDTIGSDFDILISHSTDNGANWTFPTTLNINAATDSGGDCNPQIATDRIGNWLTVWWSSDSLGGTIETDSDILYARSSPEADVKVVDHGCSLPAGEIDVSQDIPLECAVTVHNNGPRGPVEAEVTVDVVPPPDCTVTPSTVTVPVLLDVSVDEIVLLPEMTLRCAQPSHHKLEHTSSVSVTDPDVVDPDPTNNSLGPTPLNFAAIAYADSTVVEISVDYLGHDLNPETPDQDIVKSDNLTIAVTSVELNLGPWPADSVITFLADIPAGCEGQWINETATMVNHDPDFPLVQDEGLLPTAGKDPGDGNPFTAESVTSQTIPEPVGVPIPVTEVFELHCYEHSPDLVFTFCNKQELVVLPHVRDPNLENNFQCTTVVINPINLECVETVNPHGKKVPPAGRTTLPGSRGGENEDGFYELLAIGAEDFDFPFLWVLDKGSNTPFGPFSHGDKIKYTEDPDATPESKKMGSDEGQAGTIAAHIIGNGDAGLFVVYPDGTRSGVTQCHVPPPPK